MDMKTIGNQVRKSRLDSGLTQAELAERAGVSREWVVRLEAGESPGLELGKAISVFEALGFVTVPLEYLATEQERNAVSSAAFNMAYENQGVSTSEELKILREVVSERLAEDSRLSA